jgi:hypothetical protein
MAATNFSDTAAANTAVTRTLPAAPFTKYQLVGAVVSWSGTAPTIGLLTVTDNGVTVYQADIPLALNSPYTVSLPAPIQSQNNNTPFTVTVAAGGVGAVAKLDTVVNSLFYQ